MVVNNSSANEAEANKPISLKPGVMIGHQSKELINFWWAPVPDMDSGSIFYFSHYCGIGDFRRLLAFFIQSLLDYL